MKQISIDGIIGLDVYGSQVRAELEDAAGQDVELLISSPGGSVYEGLAVYNAIRDYRRNGGNVTARVVGLAASMSTYIPLAADSVAVEDNAVWMIHNPFMIAMGDYRDMQKTADLLDGIANVIVSGYERKTGKSKSELRAMMDAETYLYGEEISDAGFADSVIPAGEGAESKEEAVAMARSVYHIAAERMKQEAEKESADDIAALLQFTPEAIKAEVTPVVDREIESAAHEAGKLEEAPMDMEQLKNEHPDLYAAIKGEGREEERARVSRLIKAADSDPDNPKLQELVTETIASGESYEEISDKVSVAIRDGKKLDGENAPAVSTMPDMEALSEEDKQAAKMMGMSFEEYRKYMGGNE